MNYNGIGVASITVHITDNDAANVVISPTIGLVTTEAGGQATSMVVLTSQPTAMVTVILTSSDTSEGTVSPTTLIFAAPNWNIAQPVTITGVDDAVDDGDSAYTITTTIASGDPLYAAIVPPTVSVTNLDADVAAIAVSKLASVATANIGDLIVYTFRLINTGTVDLSALTAVDDRLGPVALDASAPTPGAVSTGMLTYTVQAGDLPGPLVNTVTASALSVGGNAIQAQAATAIPLVDAASPSPRPPACSGLHRNAPAPPLSRRRSTRPSSTASVWRTRVRPICCCKA